MHFTGNITIVKKNNFVRHIAVFLTYCIMGINESKYKHRENVILFKIYYKF
jgi:hypothetical protein